MYDGFLTISAFLSLRNWRMWRLTSIVLTLTAFRVWRTKSCKPSAVEPSSERREEGARVLVDRIQVGCSPFQLI